MDSKSDILRQLKGWKETGALLTGRIRLSSGLERNLELFTIEKLSEHKLVLAFGSGDAELHPTLTLSLSNISQEIDSHRPQVESQASSSELVINLSDGSQLRLSEFPLNMDHDEDWTPEER